MFMNLCLPPYAHSEPSLRVKFFKGFTYGHGNTTVDALYRRANLISYINKGETLAELVATVGRPLTQLVALLKLSNEI